MTLSSDCDLLYISWQVAACAQECCSRSPCRGIRGIAFLPHRDRAPWLHRVGYAFCRDRPTIHTYAIIMAATLNTIRYSIRYVTVRLVMKPGSLFRVSCSGGRDPGHGWPQRSQLPLACASLSRTGTSSNATSFNISLVVSVSSVNNRALFIESLP